MSDLSPPEGRRNTVDILGIGLQRSMTSWLHRILGAHPDAWAFPDSAPLTSNNKEAQFWTRNRQRGPDWYRVLMTPPERRATRLSMDITPEYALMSAAQIAECRALSPSARVVLILRDPLARAISALRMHTMWDHGDAPAEAVTLALDPATLARAECARLWDHAAAAGHLRRWRAAYPDLIVLNYEDLAADPVGWAPRILTACGLDPARMSGAERAELDRRAGAQVWVSRRYALHPDVIHYLHGATWQARQATEKESGFKFKELGSILEAAHGVAS